MSNLRHFLSLLIALYYVQVCLGSSVPSAQQRQNAALSMTVVGWDFALIQWESSALREKLQAWWTQPAAKLSTDEATQLVRDYLERAQRMSAIEWEINQRMSNPSDHVPEGSTAEQLQKELEHLRKTQQTHRVTVEQVIEQQIAWTLVQKDIGLSGRPWPPVKFSFTEPPKKMVVSPRTRIETVYSRMVSADISQSAIETSEKTIYQDYDFSGYITNIGGLGAYPAMVVDRASLEWVLSTVAHEWVHNYLTFFPLGINYLTSSEIATINETVADIVGNEIGAHALETFYPEFLPVDLNPMETWNRFVEERIEPQPPRFNFGLQMRLTRLMVDRLLAEGKVTEAEAYMEERRQLFVQHGYGLRVLNQAYFAFHGSYATGPASTDPIGPKLQELREAFPELSLFLQTVRGFTSLAEIDKELQSGKLQSEKKLPFTHIGSFVGFVVF